MPNQNFTDLFLLYQANVYSEMLDEFSQGLGVSSESLRNIGIGFYPLKQAWVFPERDNSGDIIGLVYRCQDGKKFMEKGSKRGLTYAVNTDYKKGSIRYVPGKHNWQRVDPRKKISCPICGKTDGCLVPTGNPSDPRAIVCVHISKGATKQLKLGHLHILKQDGQVHSSGHKLLIPSDLPIIVVEGQTDAATAMDLGFTAIGRPSAEGGLDLLPDLVKGQDVIIVGDNDAGAGKSGMESTFQTIGKICTSVIKVLPPEGIKDLREWKRNGLTKIEFLQWVEQQGVKSSAEHLLPSEVAYEIAEWFLQAFKIKDKCLMLRNYREQWIQYQDGKYEKYDLQSLRGELYRFLSSKFYPRVDVKGATIVTPYKPTRAKVSDIIDAFSARCPINSDPPIWLDNREYPDPKDLIIFKNGMLNVAEYIKTGKTNLLPLNPNLFTFNMLPYEYDPEAESELFTKFYTDVFSGCEKKIALLAQWFGYNLVPDMSMEKFMLFIGRPRSGKSTMLEVLCGMLGQEQCCSTSFQSLCGSFGYEPLVGRLAALLGDAKVPRAKESDSALEKILQITGGDPVTVNRKGIKQLPFVNLICRFTISTNDLPSFTDHARALEPRMNILDFENSYLGKEDRTLKDRLRKEAQKGKIINFALRGLKHLRKRKIFTVPESSKKVLTSFVKLATPVSDFITECCTINRNNDKIFATKNDLYDVWRGWCSEQGRRSGLKEQFSRWLLSACPQLKTDRVIIQARRYYIYRCIKLQNWTKKEYLGHP